MKNRGHKPGVGLRASIFAGSALIGLVWAPSQTITQTTRTRQPATDSRPRQLIAMERTITTQQRINRYFHNDVMPKLKTCWERVQGRGMIEIEHTYVKGADGRWVVGRLALSGSTLRRGQDAVALQCMQESVRGTSFPAVDSERTTETYVVKWSWPVPFPANAAQLTGAMFAARVNNSGSGGGGGCDGRGTAAKCYNCDAAGHECEKVCVGFAKCALTFPGRLCGAEGSCASGGPFGVSGGLIMQ